MINKENPQEESAKKSKKQVNFLQYSGMTMQMAITIGIFIFIGIKLDAWLEIKAVFTLIFALLGVGTALYTFIKKVITDNNES